MGMSKKLFAVCVDAGDYEVSLEARKLYEVLPDPDAARHEQLRVIDESGEDYLYPAALFVMIDIPDALGDRLQDVA